MPLKRSSLPANKLHAIEESNKTKESKVKSVHRFFRKAIPTMPRVFAIFCCILNILIPGFGTFLSLFSIICCSSTHQYDKNYKACLINILASILQLSSSIVIFGWIWSIRHGIMFIHLSDKEPSSDKEPDFAFYVRRHSSVDATVMNYMPTKERISFSLSRVREDDE